MLPSLLLVVDSNQPPVLKTLVPDIASPKVQGATVIWKAEAQDPEGDKILYKFQLNDRDMSRWSESANWKWSSKDLAAGDYKIRVFCGIPSELITALLRKMRPKSSVSGNTSSCKGRNTPDESTR